MKRGPKHVPLMVLVFAAGGPMPALPARAGSRALRYEVRVPASREEVWWAWTTAEGLARWYAPAVRIELRIGGPLEHNRRPGAAIGDRGTSRWRILSFDPGRMLSFRPVEVPAGTPHPKVLLATWTVFRFRTTGPGEVLVTGTTLGWEDSVGSRAAMESFRLETTQALKRLRRFFQARGDAPRPAAPAIDRLGVEERALLVAAPAAAVWEALTTEAGLRGWLAGQVEVNLACPGAIRFSQDPAADLGGEGTMTETILTYEPRRMISLARAGLPEQFPHAPAIEAVWSVFYLERLEARRSRLSVVELGFGDDAEGRAARAYYRGVDAGRLQRLGRFLEGREPSPAPDPPAFIDAGDAGR